MGKAMHMGVEYVGEISVASSQFCCEFKTALKTKILRREIKGKGAFAANSDTLSGIAYHNHMLDK